MSAFWAEMGMAYLEMNKLQCLHEIDIPKYINVWLNLPNNVRRLIVFAPFLIIIISSSILLLLLHPFLSFLPWHMNLSTADLRNYWTGFHETWWSYRYMFLVGPKVSSFVEK